MISIQLVVNVEGESTGSPGVSREFVYSKISPTPSLVTLSLADTSGITAYDWSILDQPIGASATLSDTSAAEPTFTPTANIPGSYLIQCVVNLGTGFARIGVSFKTENADLRIPAASEATQFSPIKGWGQALRSLILSVDSLVAESGTRKKAVIAIADCTLPPPSEVIGDRYILDSTTGTVHVDWDGASKLDIVEFGSSGSWVATSPEQGWVCFVTAVEKDAVYVDDGDPDWELRPTSVNLDDAYDSFGSSLATVVVDGAEGQGNLTFNLSDANSMEISLAGITGASDGFFITNGSDQIAFTRVGPNNINIDIDAEEIDISADSTLDLSSVDVFSLASPNVSLSGLGILELITLGTVSATTDVLNLTNTANSASMSGTGTGILFNQWYYDPTTPAIADAGRIVVGTGSNWTSTTTTHNSYMSFQTSLSGTVAEKMRLASNGNMTLVGDIILTNGATISSTSNSNILLTPDGTGICVVGTGAGSHGLDASGDLFVAGELEVDGVVFLDNTLSMGNNKVLALGGGVTTSYNWIMGDSTKGQALLATGSTTGNQWIIAPSAYFNKDFDKAAGSNPLLYLFSATDPDIDNTECLAMQHNITDGEILSLKGGLIQTAPASAPTLTGNSQLAFYLDESGNNLKATVQESGGGTATVTIAFD